jgi:GNAT superfamily N-acetyltransferase
MRSDTLVIRKVLTTEKTKVREHFLRLDPEDRRLRFFDSRGNGLIAAYCETLWRTGDVVLGGFVDGRMRALGELRQAGDWRHATAEIAITVERPFQNSGIGTALLRCLIQHARNRGVRTLQLFCLVDNHRMRHLTHKLGGTLKIEGGEIAVDIAPPWPSPWSLLDEALTDGAAILHASLGEPARRRPRGRTSCPSMAPKVLRAATDENGGMRAEHRSQAPVMNLTVAVSP